MSNCLCKYSNNGIKLNDHPQHIGDGVESNRPWGLYGVAVFEHAHFIIDKGQLQG